MCRFVAYKGVPIFIDELLYKPTNSLIHQSYSAQEREGLVNGDGFGVGWYAPEIEASPAVFVSVRPAWSNRNLRQISSKIRTNCLFAHVRDATISAVSEANCHPFCFGPYLMMHNGDVGDFIALKRSLREGLTDKSYNWIDGQTDSQHLFALFLDRIESHQNYLKADEIASLLEETISSLLELQRRLKLSEPSYLNLAVTDGRSMVATRYVSDPKLESATLYFSEGSHYECHDGVCVMDKSDQNERSVLIVSEKLTEAKGDWSEVPPQNIVIVEEDLSVRVRKMEVG